MKEVWKDVVDYEGKYKISNMGRIISLLNNSEKLLNPYINRYGYYEVTLCFNGKNKTSKIHRLVALAFIPNKSKLPMVNHKDSNKTNNSTDNLEWVSHRDNMIHFYNNIRKNKSCKFTGVVPRAKGWSACIATKGKREYIGPFKTIEEAAAKYAEMYREVENKSVYK